MDGSTGGIRFDPRAYEGVARCFQGRAPSPFAWAPRSRSRSAVPPHLRVVWVNSLALCWNVVADGFNQAARLEGEVQYLRKHPFSPAYKHTRPKASNLAPLRDDWQSGSPPAPGSKLLTRCPQSTAHWTRLQPVTLRQAAASQQNPRKGQTEHALAAAQQAQKAWPRPRPRRRATTPR